MTHKERVAYRCAVLEGLVAAVVSTKGFRVKDLHGAIPVMALLPYRIVSAMERVERERKTNGIKN